MLRSPVFFKIMRPITIVKRFLRGDTPSIPLPADIDEELTSDPSTGSWSLVSQSGKSGTPSKQINPTKEVECQTSSSAPTENSYPRASVKHFLGLSAHKPAAAPSFEPKSKLPKLTYGGLEAPRLHCFATASLSSPLSHTPQHVQ